MDTVPKVAVFVVPEADPGIGLEPEDKAEEEDDDVDRFSLAREFGRLLQRGEGPADG